MMILFCADLLGLVAAAVLFLVFAVECAAVYWRRR